MEITKIYWRGQEVSMESGKELVLKYIKDKMTMEAFMGGIAINTGEGILQAEVKI